MNGKVYCTHCKRGQMMNIINLSFPKKRKCVYYGKSFTIKVYNYIKQ